MSKVKDQRTKWDIGFVAGIWCSVQELVSNSYEDQASMLIYNSNIPEWEFREQNKISEYLYEELEQLLSEVFGQETE